MFLLVAIYEVFVILAFASAEQSESKRPGDSNTHRRYSIAALVVFAIIVALCAASAGVWADDEMISPPWIDEFAKGQTDGKVPPEVKTKEKEKPIGGCTKTNKDGSTETDIVYFDNKTSETTTVYYIKTKDKTGKPKTVWKIKVEKPGQPPKTTTYDPEPGNPTKTEQVDDKTPTTKTYDPSKEYVSLDIGYGAGVTIGEPPLPTSTTEKGGGGGTTTEKGGGGGGKTTETTGGGGGTTTETGGGGGGKTTETGGGGGKTTEKVPPPKKRKGPPWNLKMVTYGGPPGETVIHFGEKPKTTPEEYVRKNPTPTWDHGDGDNPKVPVETTHYVPGQVVTEHKIPHNDKPHVTETVKFPGETWTEITPDGWVNIGSGWAYVRFPVSFLYDCVGQTQEKVTETTPTGGGTTPGGTTQEGGGSTEEPPSTQEAAKKLAREKEALNPPPPPTLTKDDCSKWDGTYNPNGEGQAIKNARYDVALGEQRVEEETGWRNKDPDIVECAGYFLYDAAKGDPVRHAQDQLTRSKWQVEIYEAAYRAARANGACNESAHFAGATALHNWIQEVRWDFIQRMTLWLQALGSAILAAQVAQDIAQNLGEISKAKEASAQKAAFDKSVARVKARNAKAAALGGGAEGGGSKGGRTGPGDTQVLGPGENPYAMEKANAAPQKETQTLPPEETESPAGPPPKCPSEGPRVVPDSENPAGYIRNRMGSEGEPAAKAYEIAKKELDGDVEGIAGSYARGKPRVQKWPVNTAEEAYALTKMPEELSPAVVERMPPKMQKLYALKKQLGSYPSDLDVACKTNDPAVLKAVQERIFQQTGVLVEFTQPH